ALRRNVAATGLGEVEIRGTDVARALGAPPSGAHRRVDLVLADPPYAFPSESLVQVLGALVDNRWLADDAHLVVERSARDHPPSWPGDLTLLSSRRYSETLLWYLRWSVDQALSDG
ncbi:MAG: RsmD family RNA methyltransferase, partial [Jiangellales bacterium]